MKMCEEMKKLRAELDKRGIPWEDRSEIAPEEEVHKWISYGLDEKYADRTIYRTCFTVGDKEYSVLNSWYTFDGYYGLLECMVNGEDDVIGNIKAEDVISLIDEI